MKKRNKLVKNPLITLFVFFTMIISADAVMALSVITPSDIEYTEVSPVPISDAYYSPHSSGSGKATGIITSVGIVDSILIVKIRVDTDKDGDYYDEPGSMELTYRFAEWTEQQYIDLLVAMRNKTVTTITWDWQLNLPGPKKRRLRGVFDLTLDTITPNIFCKIQPDVSFFDID